MSTWSEVPVQRGLLRGAVLRGSDAASARPARMDSELRTSAFAGAHVIDARLTDPHLESVVAQARQQAVEQGHAQGHQAGYAAGMAVAAEQSHLAAERAARREAEAEQRRTAQLSHALAVLSTAADALREREAVSMSEIEPQIVELALGIARTVLDRELAVSKNPGREAVVRALSLAPADGAVSIRLHPDDAAALGAVHELAGTRSLTVVADPTVERGGCIAEGAGRQVDTQVGSALNRVADVLQGQLP
jgi:flagellar assembly protein FliH